MLDRAQVDRAFRRRDGDIGYLAILNPIDAHRTAIGFPVREVDFRWPLEGIGEFDKPQAPALRREAGRGGLAEARSRGRRPSLAAVARFERNGKMRPLAADRSRLRIHPIGETLIAASPRLAPTADHSQILVREFDHGKGG